MSAPKEILNKAVDQFLVKKLYDDGFTYNFNSTKFSKKNEIGFRFEINFLGSKTNWLTEFVDFKVQYLIYSSSYKTWHKKNFPLEPLIGGGYLSGDHKILLQQPQNYQPGFGYDFVKFNHEVIMNDVWENYLNFGKIYFESASNWDKVHENPTWSSLKIDSLLIQNKLTDAEVLINKALNGYLELFGHESNVPLSSKQHFDIYTLRQKYLAEINRL